MRENRKNTPALILSFQNLIQHIKLKSGFLILFSFLAANISAQTPLNSHALGFRYQGNGLGELSYQHGFKNGKRLELGFSHAGNRWKGRTFLAGTYQWNRNIIGSLGAFAGPTAAVSYDFVKNYERFLNINMGGQIGLEYDLNIHNAPILISIDTRPRWNFKPDGFQMSLALGVRYTWNRSNLWHKYKGKPLSLLSPLRSDKK